MNTPSTTSTRGAKKNGAIVIPMRKRADTANINQAMAKMYPGVKGKAPSIMTDQDVKRVSTAAVKIADKLAAGVAATAKPEVTGRILDDLSPPAFLDRLNPENEAKAVTAREKRAEDLRRQHAEAAAKPAAPKVEKPAPAPKGKAAPKPAKAAPVAKGKAAKGNGTADTPKAPVLSAAGLGALKPRKGETIREDGLPVNGIDDWMIDQVLNKAGALHSEMCAHLGTVDGSKKPWKRCSRRLARAAVVAKVKLTSKPEGDDTRFFGTR